MVSKIRTRPEGRRESGDENRLPNSPFPAVEVFVSYSHHDQQLREQLQNHLSVLQRQRVIAVWHDRRIEPGQEWRHEIDSNLEKAQIVLLLISADFLASDYCWGIEMQEALELHETGQARVIPVILRPVDWTDAPFAKLQALPENAKPVTAWQDRDEAFSSVAKGVRRAVMALADKKCASDSESITTRSARGVLPGDTGTADRAYARIGLLEGDVLSFGSDVLVLKYAQAFHGVDRVVAHMLARGEDDLASFQVPLGEYRLIDTRNTIKPKNVLYIGVQPLVYLDYAALERFAVSGLVALRQVQSAARSISFTLHGPGYGLDEREALYAVLRGFVAGISQGDGPPELQSVMIVERDNKRFKRVAQYFRSFAKETSNDRIELLSSGTLQIRVGSGSSNITEAAPKRGPDSARERRSLFVAMPFSEEFDDAYHYGIQAAAHSSGLLCERVDAVAFTGDVVERVKRGIESADLVVADLTSGNANVYLEVGYSWGCRKPTILLVRNADELKFDVKTQRCLIYKNIRDLERLLKAEIAALKRQDSVQ